MPMLMKEVHVIFPSLTFNFISYSFWFHPTLSHPFGSIKSDLVNDERIEDDIEEERKELKFGKKNRSQTVR